MAEEGGAEWAVGLRYGFRAPGLPEGVDPEEAAARAREELPEPTGTHEGLDALDVARISRILVRAFGMRGLAVDEATEVILRDGWRRA